MNRNNFIKTKNKIVVKIRGSILLLTLTALVRSEPATPPFEITTSGWAAADTFFLEFSPGGNDYKVTSSETLDFSTATDVTDFKLRPTKIGENRFEFHADSTIQPKNFFRIEKLNLPYVQSITALGDSITSGAAVNSANARDDGYMGSYFDLDEHRMTPVFAQPEGTWYQTGGFTSQMIIDTWLPRVVTDRPDVCVILAGTNSLDDARSISSDLDVAAEWLFAQNKTIVDTLVSAGIKPIYCTMTPDSFPSDSHYPPASGSYSVDYRTIRKKVNDLARANIEARGAILCDWAGVLSTNPGDDEAPADTNLLFDNIHPNGQGHIQLAKFLQKIIHVNFTTPEPFTIPPYSDPSWLLPNPYLEGDSVGLASGWNSYGSATTKSASKAGPYTQRLYVKSDFGALKSVSFERYMQVTDDSLDGITIRPVCRLIMPDSSKLPVWVELKLVSSNLDNGQSAKYSFSQYLGGSGNANSFTRHLAQNDMLMLGPPIKTATGENAERRRITIIVYVYGGDTEAKVDLETCGVIRLQH
ncbi:MAG: SGNH/GDSL hydrolase family protein [Luteolibacter sp.]